MSFVFIREHDESIFKMLEPPPPPEIKTPRYYSALEKELRMEKKPQLRLTMGWPDMDNPKADIFMRKGEGTQAPRKYSDHTCIKRCLPPVPKRSDAPKKIIKPAINFKYLNILRASKKETKKEAEPKLIDQRNGHVKTLKGSGEIPEYSRRKDFGDIPAYLKRFKNKVELERKMSAEAESARKSACNLISEKDRQQLLHDLKTKWSLKQKQFLQLPIITDTLPKKNKKTKLEQELIELEKDIALIEKNKYIYIFP